MEKLRWTNAEGLQIVATNWPANQAKAAVTLVHGIGEHAVRYSHLAQWFNQNGIAVLGYDQQGYGRSAGRRGHAKSLDVLLDDIGQALEATRKQYSDIPLFLYGHSMGGNLVLNYLLRHQPTLAGVIATGPWIRLAFPAPLLKVLAGRLLKPLLPNLRLPNGLVVRYISRDPAVVEAYQNDLLVHNQLSVAAGIQLLDAAIWLDQYRGKTPSPLLLQHGGGDKLTSVEATAAFAKRLDGDVTFKEWPDLYHEIHNEPEQEAVFAYTLAWLLERLDG